MIFLIMHFPFDRSGVSNSRATGDDTSGQKEKKRKKIRPMRSPINSGGHSERVISSDEGPSMLP